MTLLIGAETGGDVNAEDDAAVAGGDGNGVGGDAVVKMKTPNTLLRKISSSLRVDEGDVGGVGSMDVDDVGSMDVVGSARYCPLPASATSSNAF